MLLGSLRASKSIRDDLYCIGGIIPKLITLNSTTSPAAGTETASFAASKIFNSTLKTGNIYNEIVLLQQRYSGWPGAFAAAQIKTLEYLIKKT